MLSSLLSQVNNISTSALSPGCNVVPASLSVIISPFSYLQSGLSSCTKISPSGLSSLISVASPAISPSFVTRILYLNLTTTSSNLLFLKSTFTTSSGSSSALCPVSVYTVFPFSITIACVTHLRSFKSNLFDCFPFNYPILIYFCN